MADVRSCGVLIFRVEPRRSFLLMRHANRWDLPKGHVDPGESDLECALRELQEETGLEPDDVDIDPKFVFHHEYYVTPRGGGDQKLLKRLSIFLGQLKRPRDIEVSEHAGYRWFDWSPPHQIQPETIDPLLAALACHWDRVDS